MNWQASAFVLILLLMCTGSLPAQQKSATQPEWVDSVMLLLRDDQNLDAKEKSDLADSAYQLSRVLRDTCRQINARIKQATYLDELGIPDSALIQLYWASIMYPNTCDSSILMSLYANLTNIYLSLGETERIDSVSRIAMSAWNRAWKDRRPRFIILNNLGIARFTVDDTLSATALFRRAYHEAKEDRDFTYEQRALSNLGTIKGATGDLDSAFYFFNLAAINADKNNDVNDLMDLLINLANLDVARGRPQRAMIALDSAYQLATSRQNQEVIAAVQNARADMYASMNRFKEAFHYQKEFTNAREEYLNAERVKSVTDAMEKYESEKKARQIQQLELDKLDAELVNARITSSRNRFLFGGIFVLLISLGLWSRLRYVRKSRTAIQKEKDISEGLLLNILPESVAGELKQKGYAEARHYDMATILFSDFRGFTSFSETMSAADLVDELNVCFKAFDEIMIKYGIEKIKTIGDSYMAAAGLPDTNTSTAGDLVHAGIEMQQFMLKRRAELEARQLPAFEMRIGIHSGPVVAGIVGLKKFQYDIWGDAVNTASRMESSGEVGRVNISEDTYRLVKDNPQFFFTPRGKISAKGKGELEMYFVDAAAP